MISLKRTNQGGSVQTFFIIALMLVIITIGMARFVEQHGAQVRRDQAIALAEKQAKTDQAASDSSSNSSTGSNSTNTGEVAVPSSDSSASTTTAAVTESSALPTTGPSDMTIVNIVLSGLLSAVTVAYFASRRMLARSL